VENTEHVVAAIPLAYYLLVSAVLFTIGTVGFLVKRNPIVMFMCIELMLNAVNLSLVAFSRYFGDIGGQIMVLFVMAVAASEVAVGLGIIISIYRNKEELDIDSMNILKG
jgi:NADH-quinone oxidoreductase subunit K